MACYYEPGWARGLRDFTIPTLRHSMQVNLCKHNYIQTSSVLHIKKYEHLRKLNSTFIELIN